MKNTLKLPAHSTALCEEELTYTEGGGIALLTGLAVGAAYIYNYVWGLRETRKWIRENKTSNAITTVTKAADATGGYWSSSVLNCLRGVFTAMQFTTLWPVTAVAWLTADTGSSSKK